MDARRGNTWGRHGFGAAAITGGMIGVSGVGASARTAGPRGIGMHTDRQVAPSGAQASNPGMRPTTMASAATTAMAGVMAEATRRAPRTPPASGGPQQAQGSGPVGAVAARYGVPEYHREAGTSEFRLNEIADQTMRNQPVGPAAPFGGERPQASVGGPGYGGSGVGGPTGTEGFASAQVAAQHRWGMADRSGSGPRHATPDFGSADSRPPADPLNADPRPHSGAPGTPGPSGVTNAPWDGQVTGLPSAPAGGLPNGLAGGPANGLAGGPANGLSGGPHNGPSSGPANGLPSGAADARPSSVANGPSGFVGNAGGSVSDGFLAGNVAALATGFDSYGGREEPATAGHAPSDGGLSSGLPRTDTPNSTGFGTGSMNGFTGTTAGGGPAAAGPTTAGGLATPRADGPTNASTGSRHARPEEQERSARHAAPNRAGVDGSALGSLDSSTLWGSLSLPSVPPR